MLNVNKRSVKNKKRIAIFGGTFDPIHKGHIDCANVALKKFNLDMVIFVPAGIPNFKNACELESAKSRLDLCCIAIECEDNDKFKVSDIEINKNTTSYTSETLEYFSKKYKNSTLYFIVGTDAFLTLETWHNSKSIFEYANIIVVSRHKYNLDLSTESKFLNAYKDKINYLTADTLDISSSDIRKYLKNNLDSTLLKKYLYTEQIDYIKANKIYK